MRIREARGDRFSGGGDIMHFDPAEIDESTLVELRSRLIWELEKNKFTTEEERSHVQEMARKAGQELEERELLRRFYAQRGYIKG
jgi:hypothetical protein